MAFEIEQSEVEGIALLRLQGRLILGGATCALQDAVSAALGMGKARMILDFADSAYVDSGGLGVLVAAHTDVLEAGGSLKLLRLSKREMDLLVLTKLTTLFEIFDEEGDAIDSFFPERARRQFDILEFVKSQEGETQHLGSATPEEARREEEPV